MDTFPIKILSRTQTGKGGASKVRNAGSVPATLYGRSAGALTVRLDPREVIRVLRTRRGRNSALSLEWEGDVPEGGQASTLAMIKDYQIHPVKRKLLHVDLLRVEPDTPVVVNVPVKTIGKSLGEERGARLDLVTRAVKLRCRVDKVPDSIDVDVTPYELGFTLYSKDLEYPEGTEPAFKNNFPIFSIAEIRVIEEEVPEEEEGEEGEEGAEGEEKAEASSDDAKADESQS